MTGGLSVLSTKKRGKRNTVKWRQKVGYLVIAMETLQYGGKANWKGIKNQDQMWDRNSQKQTEKQQGKKNRKNRQICQMSEYFLIQ